MFLLLWVYLWFRSIRCSDVPFQANERAELFRSRDDQFWTNKFQRSFSVHFFGQITSGRFLIKIKKLSCLWELSEGMDGWQGTAQPTTSLVLDIVPRRIAYRCFFFINENKVLGIVPKKTSGTHRHWKHFMWKGPLQGNMDLYPKDAKIEDSGH